MLYDFGDPLVKDLVARNHVPFELMVKSAGGDLVMNGVVCEQCGQSWPCVARLQLREWEERRLKDSYRPRSPDDRGRGSGRVGR